MNVEERNDYLVNNLGLWHKMARHYARIFNMNYEETLSCCYEGAIKALDKANTTQYCKTQINNFVVTMMRWECIQEGKRQSKYKKIEMPLDIIIYKEQGNDHFRRNQKNES